MKELITTIYRALISPSMRFKLRMANAWLREQIDKTRIWRWERITLPRHQGRPYNFFYWGRKDRRELALKLLEANKSAGANQVSENMPLEAISISDIPFFGTLRVPSYINAIVPLGKSLEEITASYGENLRRLIRNRKLHYRTQQLLDINEIIRAEKEMLRPFATARHGVGAAQLSLDEVQRIALKAGRLDLVYFGGQVVACHLGYAFTRNNKRYWAALRFGYPESVFSDPKRLEEVNTINCHLALEWAIQNGYDYYDIGGCLARPEDGLLQWKKRRGAAVDVLGNFGHFYIKLPKNGVARFLWDSPLFSIEQSTLALHLGLPDGPSDKDIATRYSQMGFCGLSTIYLHCEYSPSKDILERLHGLFNHQIFPTPSIKVIQANAGRIP